MAKFTPIMSKLPTVRMILPEPDEPFSSGRRKDHSREVPEKVTSGEAILADDIVEWRIANSQGSLSCHCLIRGCESHSFRRRDKHRFEMLKFGVIGTSWITDSFIESSQATGKWQLVAVYSRKRETAEIFASKHGVSVTFTSIEELCRDANVDAVYIASPNSLHYEHAKIVLAAGKHAIVEKPVTSNLREFDALYSFAKTAPRGAQLIEAYRHIQEANFKVLKRSLGQLGPIYGGHFSFAQYSSRYNAVLKGETPNVFSAEFSGGCLVDMGVYPICFAIALFGKPKRQSYHPIMLHTGTDGGGPIILHYDTFTVTLYTSKCYASTAVSEVYGEKGTISMNGVTDIDSLLLKTVADKRTVELAGKKARYNLMEEAEEFHRLISEEDAAGIAALAELSRHVTEVTENLRRANGIHFPADSP